MKINGIVLDDVDITDADRAEEIELQIQKVADRTNSLDKSLPRSQVIRAYCGAIFECFDSIFGAGTSNRIFSGKCNLLTAVNAYAELIKEINRLDAEAANKIKQQSQKFTADRSKNQNRNQNKKRQKLEYIKR